MNDRDPQDIAQLRASLRNYFEGTLTERGLHGELLMQGIIAPPELAELVVYQAVLVRTRDSGDIIVSESGEVLYDFAGKHDS